MLTALCSKSHTMAGVCIQNDQAMIEQLVKEPNGGGPANTDSPGACPALLVMDWRLVGLRVRLPPRVSHHQPRHQPPPSGIKCEHTCLRAHVDLWPPEGSCGSWPLQTNGAHRKGRRNQKLTNVYTNIPTHKHASIPVSLRNRGPCRSVFWGLRELNFSGIRAGPSTGTGNTRSCWAPGTRGLPGPRLLACWL